MSSRVAFTLALVGMLCANGTGARSDEATPPAGPSSAAKKSTLNVDTLFAGVCGFCHNDGGRKAGRGPQLMNTTRSDDFIRFRIKHGKEGAMPAFSSFSDADIDAIIAYIRNLKPENS